MRIQTGKTSEALKALSNAAVGSSTVAVAGPPAVSPSGPSRLGRKHSNVPFGRANDFRHRPRDLTHMIKGGCVDFDSFG